MTSQEYEIAKHVATKCLDLKISFNDVGKLKFELGDTKWDFIKETDAEAVEKIAIIFNQINACMWEIINEEILSFVSENKKNFN